MKKIILKILIIIQIAIIIFGIFAGKSVKDQVRNEGMPIQNIYIDGTDITNLTETTVEIGSTILGIAMIIYSILVVACVWGIYGIILLIIIIIKRCKLQRNK